MAKMTKNLLMISYFFPPVGGVGVQRALKFSRYLPEFGWIPHVISAGPDCTYPRRDSSLLAEFPPQGKLYPINSPRDAFGGTISQLPGLQWLANKIRHKKVNLKAAIHDNFLVWNWLDIPDDKIDWAWVVYSAALKIIRREKIDCIFTTSAPYSSHLAGLWLKQRTGLPWVADFRDEWSENPNAHYLTSWHKNRNKSLEHQVMQAADKVLTISEFIYQKYLTQISSDKCVLIHNGFDPKDFPMMNPDVLKPNPQKFTIVYVGNFYNLPKTFLKAIEELLEEGQIQQDEIEFRHVGTLRDIRFENSKYQSIVNRTGYQVHQQALENLFQADVFLLIIDYPGSSTYLGDYSGKLFEYLAAEKPILALVPQNGAAANLIARTHSGLVVSPDDSAGIRKSLLDLFQQWKAGCLAIQPDRQLISTFNRRNQTERLAGILNSVTESDWRLIKNA
jgi:hypothetical protein